LSPLEKQLLQQAGGKILLFGLSGPMSFGAAKSISQRMSIVKDYDVLILDLSDVPMIGITASLAIENMVKDAKGKRREGFIVGASGEVKARLRKLQILELLPPRNRVDRRIQALQLAMAIVGGGTPNYEPRSAEYQLPDGETPNGQIEPPTRSTIDVAVDTVGGMHPPDGEF